MPHAVLMPKLGMSMTEGTVLEWNAEPGDHVEKGDILLVIESEKAQVELEATDSGILRHLYIQPDETVPCGTLLAVLTDSADDAFDPDAFRREHEAANPPTAPTATAPAPSRAPASSPQRTAAGATPATPAARRRARDADMDLAHVQGTGPGGRITVEDVEACVARRAALRPVAEGVALEVLTAGAGDPVLLLPGFGTDVSAFARQTPALAERYLVLGVNPRGVGLSDAPDEPSYAVSQAAEDAAAVTDTPAHVIGASLGAAVALELALTHPGHVRTLTLITPFVEADGRLIAVCEAWGALVRQTDAETAARAMLPWFFSPATLAEDATRALLARGLAQTLARVPAPTLERSLAGMRAWSGTRHKDLGRLTMPTLVVAAEADLLTPDGEALAAAIPHARCVLVPGAGHAVAIEAPDSVTAAVLAHLNGDAPKGLG